MIGHAPSPFGNSHALALSPLKIAAGRGAIADTQRGVGVAHTIAQRRRDLPHCTPDFETAVRLAKRDRLLERLAPRANIFERDRPQIDIAENWFDLFPAAPPVLAGARCLALPLVCVPVASERFAERPRRGHGQFLGSLRRQIFGGSHGRRGGLTALHCLPASIPLLGTGPCVRAIVTTWHGVEAECPHVRAWLPKGAPVAAHAVVRNLQPSHFVAPPSALQADPRRRPWRHALALPPRLQTSAGAEHRTNGQWRRDRNCGSLGRLVGILARVAPAAPPRGRRVSCQGGARPSRAVRLAARSGISWLTRMMAAGNHASHSVAPP